jgi:hypothetical protein
MPRRLGDQGEQHELQILAAEFAAAREAVVVAEAAIAAPAPKRAPSAVTMPVTADRMPKLMEKRAFSRTGVMPPFVAAHESVAVVMIIRMLSESVMPVTRPISIAGAGRVRVTMVMRMRMRAAEIRVEAERIVFETAIGGMKTVSHGSLLRE